MAKFVFVKIQDFFINVIKKDFFFFETISLKKKNYSIFLLGIFYIVMKNNIFKNLENQEYGLTTINQTSSFV